MASPNTKTKLIAIVIAAALCVPFFTYAVDYNHLLDDSDLFTRRLSQERIQSLLAAKGGLGAYATDVDGTSLTAAQIFFQAQEQYGINAAYLIATAQKESSIVTASTLQDWQLNWTMGFAVCDSCSLTDPDVVKYKGFYQQVSNAARVNKLYQQGGYSFAVGKTSTVDGVSVTPENQATANMFIYTPHLHGNELVTNIYKGWFGIPTHPEGAVVSVSNEKNSLYLVAANNVLRPYTSTSAFYANHKASEVVTIDPSEKALYTLGSPIRFADFSIISIPGGRLYLVRGDKISNIQSPAVFRKLGFNPEEIQKVSNDDIAGYSVAEPITLADSYPQAILRRVKGNPGVWYIVDNTRYAIPDRAYLKQLPPLKIKTMKLADFDKLQDGGKLRLKEGTLVTSPSASSIYVISGGFKRAFDSKQTFDSLGYSMKNVISVTDRTLADDIHPTGSPVTMAIIDDAVAVAAAK